MNQPIQVRSGSGNVFADLEIENAEELLVKAELARKISSIITTQKMTQTEAAKLLGKNPPKVSALVNGKLSVFSIKELLSFLNARLSGRGNCGKTQVFHASSNTSSCVVILSSNLSVVQLFENRCSLTIGVNNR